MKFTKRSRKVHTQPPMPERHPSISSSGEAGKTFIIAIITIVAVIALSLLLLFSDQLVGKAITIKAQEAGIEDVEPYANLPFSIVVKANAGREKVKALSIKLNVPTEIPCTKISHVDKTGWLSEKFSCETDARHTILKFAAVRNPRNPSESYLGGSVDFEIVEFQISGLPATFYKFAFPAGGVRLTYDSGVVTNFITKDATIEVTIASCGDSVPQALNSNNEVEECDDGNNVDTDKCNQQCKKTVCGDAIVQDPNGDGKTEVCDTAASNGMACTAMYGESCQYCSNTCEELITVTGPSCGDGMLDDKNGEECDNGVNNADGSECSSMCKSKVMVEEKPTEEETEMGKVCTAGTWICEGMGAHKRCNDSGSGYDDAESCAMGKTCNLGQCLAEGEMPTEEETEEEMDQSVIGDGMIESGEECDDSNQMNNDGCSSTGQVESGFTCVSEPSDCEMEVEMQAVCAKNEWVCEGMNALKQCNADGTAYNAAQNCAEGQKCEAGVCAIPPTVIQGTKISLIDVPAADNEFTTIITASQTFTQEVTVYTVLYGADNKVLSIKSEKIEGGLTEGGKYSATLNYPQANVQEKLVLVFDVEQNPTVFAQLHLEKS